VNGSMTRCRTWWDRGRQSESASAAVLECLSFLTKQFSRPSSKRLVRVRHRRRYPDPSRIESDFLPTLTGHVFSRGRDSVPGGGSADIRPSVVKRFSAEDVLEIA